jgi:ATP-dependent protease HslVU (ClpYQ) peptidase subunit
VTAIACVWSRGRAYMAADSLVTVGDRAVQIAAPKAWRAGPLIVGCAGALDYLATLAGVQWPADVTPPRAGALIRSALREAGIDLSEGEALIGGADGIWAADSGTCYRLRGSIAAAGSGAEYALGALHVTSGDPVIRVRAAIGAARAWCPSVGGRVIVVSSDARRRRG